MMQIKNPFWQKMFWAAALFNFAMSGFIILAPRWSYTLAYLPLIIDSNAIALKFWRDFGFSVLLIGVGYYLVSRDVDQNRSIVWLGIFAKLFDVIVLTQRFVTGVAKPLVLFPAIVDGIFVLLFALFLYQTRHQALQLTEEMDITT